MPKTRKAHFVKSTLRAGPKAMVGCSVCFSVPFEGVRKEVAFSLGVAAVRVASHEVGLRFRVLFELEYQALLVCPIPP
jgi:hypothetical protein